MKFYSKLLVAASLSIFFACGGESSSSSSLKGNPVLTYVYNADGSQGGFSWVINYGKAVGSTLPWSYTSVYRSQPKALPLDCMISGPNITLPIGVSGWGHADAVVDLSVTAGTVDVIFMSDAEIYKKVTVKAPFNGLLKLDGPLSSVPIANIQVKVCNLQYDASSIWGYETDRPRFYERTSSGVVRTTTLIIN